MKRTVHPTDESDEFMHPAKARKVMSCSMQEIQSCFSRFDVDNSGAIDVRELAQALQVMKGRDEDMHDMDCDNKCLRLLMGKFGVLNFNGWVHVHGYLEASMSCYKASGCSGTLSDFIAEKVQQENYHTLQSVKGTQPESVYCAQFVQCDVDGSGTIDAPELAGLLRQVALQFGQLEITDHSAMALMAYFGQLPLLNWAKLVEFVTETKSMRARGLFGQTCFDGVVAKRILSEPLEVMHCNSAAVHTTAALGDLQETFRRCDQDKSGSIDALELRKAFEDAGIKNVDGGAASALLGCFGSISLSGWLQATQFVQQSKGEFHPCHGIDFSSFLQKKALQRMLEQGVDT